MNPIDHFRKYLDKASEERLNDLLTLEVCKNGRFHIEMTHRLRAMVLEEMTLRTYNSLDDIA